MNTFIETIAEGHLNESLKVLGFLQGFSSACREADLQPSDVIDHVEAAVYAEPLYQDFPWELDLDKLDVYGSVVHGPRPPPEYAHAA